MDIIGQSGHKIEIMDKNLLKNELWTIWMNHFGKIGQVEQCQKIEYVILPKNQPKNPLKLTK